MRACPRALNRLSRRLAVLFRNGHVRSPSTKGRAVCAKLPQGLSGGGVALPSVHCDVGHCCHVDDEKLVEAPGGEARFHLSPSTTALGRLARCSQARTQHSS